MVNNKLNLITWIKFIGSKFIAKSQVDFVRFLGIFKIRQFL
jgi:hypothetical protein